ncbi:MFS transporter [Stutzerimonas stutzeri]|uniref:MFS transporter n=1 Tax=Stutzerimonas stutzeri TaxID=316 RepID=A0A6I6LRF8_STUST|nr:MFS transporter [Stutzerimonas stutzeri]QGZ30966.1 MFS transporter [Stutzerimonas stutzeri]
MGRGFFPLMVTLAIQALASMASFTVPVLAPAAARELAGPVALVGVYVALIYLSAMVTSLLSGGWVVRFGAIRISQVCLLLCTAGLLCAASGTLTGMALSALLIGAGYGPVTPASSHILARTTPAHLMGFMFSLKQTGVPLGGVLAGVMVPSLVATVSWQGAAIAVALACATMMIIAQPFRAALDDDRQPGHAGPRDPLRPLVRVFQHRPIRDLALCSFCFGAMQLCLTTYLVTYLTHEYGLPLTTAGLVLAITQGAGMVGRLFWGWIADRWLAPRRLLPLLALAMGLAAGLTAAFDADWPLAVVMLVSALFGATAIGWNGVYLAEVARLAPPGTAGLYTGGTLFFTYFGVVAGPPVFALIAEASGSLASGYATFAVLLLAIGLLLGHFARRPAPVTGSL